MTTSEFTFRAEREHVRTLRNTISQALQNSAETAGPGISVVIAALRADTVVRNARPRPVVGTFPVRPVLSSRIPAA
ncbi:hypothetical protein ACFWXO_21850 [Kitasatospora sp. NPDC059088]|uniref:hypothetical protein n=1 Tax=Kitasatospora sp. NPDC059088 TaxID=3346722 RepID=UPI0036D0155E